MSDSSNWTIGLVGYGEVGRILGEDLNKGGIARVLAYDIKLGGPAQAPLLDHAETHGVKLAASHAALAAEADLIVSAVTASQDVAVAEACAPGIKRGAYFLDFNSASPGAKRRAAEFIDWMPPMSQPCSRGETEREARPESAGPVPPSLAANSSPPKTNSQIDVCDATMANSR